MLLGRLLFPPHFLLTSAEIADWSWQGGVGRIVTKATFLVGLRRKFVIYVRDVKITHATHAGEKTCGLLYKYLW